MATELELLDIPDAKPLQAGQRCYIVPEAEYEALVRAAAERDVLQERGTLLDTALLEASTQYNRLANSDLGAAVAERDALRARLTAAQQANGEVASLWAQQQEQLRAAQDLAAAGRAWGQRGRGVEDAQRQQARALVDMEGALAAFERAGETGGEVGSDVQ